MHFGECKNNCCYTNKHHMEPLRHLQSEKNKQKCTVSCQLCVVMRVLTWFLGCDIDYAALWTNSSTVIGPQGHAIGTAALKIPDEYWSFIPHRPNHTGCVLLLFFTPVPQLKNTQQINRYHFISLHVTSVYNYTFVGMNPGGLQHAHILRFTSWMNNYIHRNIKRSSKCFPMNTKIQCH